MSSTIHRAREFLRLYSVMEGVYHSEASWDAKYELIFDLAREIDDLGFKVDYYNPDTSYKEDVIACVQAYGAKAADLTAALGPETSA